MRILAYPYYIKISIKHSPSLFSNLTNGVQYSTIPTGWPQSGIVTRSLYFCIGPIPVSHNPYMREHLSLVGATPIVWSIIEEFGSIFLGSKVFDQNGSIPSTG